MAETLEAANMRLQLILSFCQIPSRQNEVFDQEQDR
jgi:hypothetical protein